MGQKLLLDVAPTGVQHSIDTDEDGFYAVEHTPTIVEDEILDECAKLRGLHQTGTGNLKLAAKVPILLYYQWKKEWREKYSDTWSWPVFETMKINNRDHEKMRTGYKRGGSMKL